MANETKKESSKKEKQHGRRRNSYLSYDKNYVIKALARISMGQKILKKTEHTLNAIEVTAKWGLPQDDSKDTLERPLPWLVFLPLLLWFRIFFGICFIAHHVVGLPLINAYSSVNYIKCKRLRLKAFRLQGLKTLRDRENKVVKTTTTTTTTTNENKSLKGLFWRIFERAICKPTQDDEVPAKPVIIKTDKNIVNSTPVLPKKLPKIAVNVDDEEDDSELTVNEMLDKYADVDSENDPDYIPEECIESDNSASDSGQSSSPEAEIAPESKTVSNETKQKPINGEVQENCKKVVIGETQVQNENQATDKIKKFDKKGKKIQQHVPTTSDKLKEQKITTAATDKKQHLNTPVSEQEQINTPDTVKPNMSTPDTVKLQINSPDKIEPQINISDINDAIKQQIQQPVKESEAVETPGEVNEMTAAAATEVATDTPKSVPNNMTAPVLEDNEKKSTPGHDTAATSTIPTTVPLNFSPEKEKSYRTITTQTAIELDWTITIKTEITHKKHSPKLEKLNYSVNLSPASSAEDVFYSPMGSFQDVHTFFHPGPLVIDAPSRDRNSCTKDDDSYYSPSSGTPPPVSTGTKKKIFNKHYHQNSKNFTKNRR